MDSSVSDYISHCLEETGTCPKALVCPPTQVHKCLCKKCNWKYANLSKPGEESREDHHGRKPGSSEPASAGRTHFCSSAPLVKTGPWKSQDIYAVQLSDKTESGSQSLGTDEGK